MTEALSIRELELNIRALNTIEHAYPGCTIGQLRGLMGLQDEALFKNLRKRDIKEVWDCLANIPAPAPGLFDHITAETVRAERNQTGNGMMQCKLEMQRAALLSHLDSTDEIDTRAIIRWLVERAV